MDKELFFKQTPIGHVRYINIQAWLRGFRVKIANFSRFFCPSIPKGDLDTKKTTPNIEVWPESLGAMLEYWYIERGLFVEYNGHFSSRTNISCGVPQGSILGPLFFLLYINDINNASKILQLILFADDTNVFLSHKDADCLANILNTELNKLSIWFRANKLSLNLKKKLNSWYLNQVKNVKVMIFSF